MNDNYAHVDNSVMYVVENILGPVENTEEFTDLLDKFHSQLAVHCTCRNQCLQSCCSCLQSCGGDNYISTNCSLKYLLNRNKDFKTYPLVECNSSCQCSDTCGNRVVQNGPIDNLVIRKCASTVKGWGLYTKNEIPNGAFICEYAGEVITKSEAMKRHALNKSNCEMNYIFCLNEFSDAQVLQTFVDPSKFGNIGRYMNYSCDPNCFIIPVRVDSPIPKLAIFSHRRILPEEELTFNYGSDTVARQEVSEHNEFITKTICLCGSKSCKKYLPFEMY